MLSDNMLSADNILLSDKMLSVDKMLSTDNLFQQITYYKPTDNVFQLKKIIFFFLNLYTRAVAK
jgi:hypothetical protein